ncbi:hypothetical protein O6H91_17G060100 [Diphasiastrum complanatum]|uniref:Uncharacterized protein n=14 Tax=Diphasiastrum complanatum TaxID=34168 RepID=A0ACC2B884_DIPCM|nr:hypothetical protein O6H91_17G060100 [Diphasiastrum complanatum]KAJ7525630.1 hypothetical protein O6H91_17G060100 [Diphasiastrum complanatum]KAJ7525631.1 hypothetical protein O6H91_17G060100 [Diphasiastrum complanatum]KAJ7525632.1 hypothetical protein O6H91_17G060100 [Diphasiastrum complanatum]KAJ7525633.1 hypothetical protein O6H91_17G060100 [Diphasiastrum complanatum]
MAPQSERSKIDQIVAEFFAKSLHIILESRIPYVSSQTDDSFAASSLSSASSLAVRPKDRWFNLVLGDCPAAQSSVEPWRSSQLGPMIVDVLLIQSTAGVSDKQPLLGTSPQRPTSHDPWIGEDSSTSIHRSSHSTVLERWIVRYDRRTKGSSGMELGMRRSGSGNQSIVVEGEMLAGKDGSGGDTHGLHTMELKQATKGSAKATGSQGWTKADGGPQLPPFPSHAIEVPGLYKRMVIMMRSLYCTVRTLPAHRLFRLANSSSANRGFSLSYRVSASPPEVDEAAMTTCSLTPVETPTGRMCLSVSYHHTTAITALEIMPRVQPRIIVDYVGSPNTDPIRRISSASYLGSVSGGGLSGRVGVHVVPLPSSLPNSPSGGSFGRRHSWSGGVNKVQPALLPPSSPSKRNSRSPSPSYPRDVLSNSPHTSSPLRYSPSPRSSTSYSSCTRQAGSHPSSFHPTETGSSPIPIQEHRPSPPFSPSLSPSSPSSYQSQENGSTVGYPCNSSAPVSIPRSSVARTQRFIVAEGSSPHHGKSALPPPSPRSKSIEPPLQALHYHSPSSLGQVSHQLVPAMDAKFAARLSISSLAESSLFLSPTHPYRTLKVGGGEKGAEGPPSGLKISIYGSPRKSFSRCHSKSSLRDESDNEEFACPFAVDDDEVEYGNRVEYCDTTGKGNECYDGISQKSQDAAVGALVRVLRSARPLRDLNVSANTDGTGARSFGLAGTPTGTSKLSGLPLVSKNKYSTAALHSGSCNSPICESREPGSEIALSSSPQVTSHVSMDQSSYKNSKTAADALEELKNYKEMRDFLLRQCGRKVATGHSFRGSF